MDRIYDVHSPCPLHSSMHKIPCMGKRSETDKAIRNIMNWSKRPEWSEEQVAVFDVHLAPVCDRTDITQEVLIQELEEHGFGGMLSGVIFEDFISRRLPDERNIIDDLLQRRGWRESVPGRHYMQQLRDSVLSLYEVVEVSPGRHCDLRDLVRDGEELVFCETRFPFHAEQLDEIARQLGDAADWERDSPDEQTWSWLPETDIASGKPRNGMAMESLRNGQLPLSGILELTPGVLKLVTNSSERAQGGQAVLESNSCRVSSARP
jgi:hypothetical protein